MSSFEWNKIIASVLTAMIVAMAAGILASELVRPKPLEKPVFLAGRRRAAGGRAGGATARQQSSSRSSRCSPTPTRKRGEQLDQGLPAVPHLQQGRAEQDRPESLGRYRRGIAEVPGYQFPARLQADKGKKWDPDKLNEWLYSPQDPSPRAPR